MNSIRENSCGEFKENIAIGYNQSSYPVNITLSILGMGFNVLFIGIYIKRYLQKQITKLSSLEWMLLLTMTFQLFIGLFWLINAIIFYDSNTIYAKCNGCKALSFTGVFLYFFNWFFFTAIIAQFNQIGSSSIKVILSPGIQLLKYIIICLVLSLAITVLATIAQLNGISPMINCFLHIPNNKDLSSGYLVLAYITALIPIGILCFILYQTISIYKSKVMGDDKEIKHQFSKYLIYISINIFFDMMMYLFYIIAAFISPIDNLSMRVYAYVINIILVCNPLLLSLVMLYQNFFNDLCRIIKGNQTQANDISLNFSLLEGHALIKFIREIYTSICYALYHSKTHSFNADSLNDESSHEEIKHIITKNQISLDKQNPLNQDEVIGKNFFISIEAVEIAPKIFAEMRKVEEIDNDHLINCLLPMNNQQEEFKSSNGKSGSLFLNTTDKSLTIKTITENEVDLLKNTLLLKMVHYLRNNKESLICRLYGLYELKTKTGLFSTREDIVILMQNIDGVFEQNILSIYDLKGSVLDRKTYVKDNNFRHSVLKDLNFTEIEGTLQLDYNHSTRLYDTILTDAQFLSSVGIIDYSLLVVKLTVNEDEKRLLFNDPILFDNSTEVLSETDVKITIPYPIVSKELPIPSNTNDQNFKPNIRFKINNLNHIKKYLFPSNKEDIVYIISIIDYFTVFDMKKNLEAKIKQLHGSPREISCAPPKEYCERFIEMVQKITAVQL